MRKKNLAIFTLLSLGLFLLGIATFVAISVILNSMHCFTPKCASLPEWNLGYMMFVAAGVLQIIAWLGTMITQIKRKQWAWFVCTFLFSPISTWIYLLAVPEVLGPLVPVYMLPEQSVYKPYAQGYGAPQPADVQPGVYQESEQRFQYLE